MLLPYSLIRQARDENEETMNWRKERPKKACKIELLVRIIMQFQVII